MKQTREKSHKDMIFYGSKIINTELLKANFKGQKAATCAP